ncbi:MAG: hypothetical protein KAV01_12620 [Candidatus Lokiarchaeota archaeon]|nr:hypothetical protein [Candidatus Lokiarchaeota archaeon]
MVSELGLLDGLTASLIILSSTTFGLLSLYKSIKLKAKLLTVAAMTMFFVGCFWLGPTIDLLMGLVWQTNITPIRLYAIFSYMWMAPALLFSMWLGGELLFPKKKWIIVGIYLILGLVFEYFLWFHTNESFEFTPPPDPGDLIDASFVRAHPTFLLIAFFLVSVLIVLGIGFAVKAKQSTGQLRKKFAYLSVGFIIFVLCGALDSILTIPVAIGAVRIVMATFALWMYLGLKT